MDYNPLETSDRACSRPFGTATAKQIPIVRFRPGNFSSGNANQQTQTIPIMKYLLLPLLVGCTALLPTTPLRAETFGDFTAGQTFTLKVTERETTRTKGLKTATNVALPAGIPDFAVGENVKFTIGRQGQLKGPGFVITFRRGTDRVNFYANRPTLSSPSGDAAAVRKNLRGKPVRAALTFYDFNFSGLIPVVVTAEYVLER
jgi:hypothetical protein